MLETQFYILLSVGAFSPEKVPEMVEKRSPVSKRSGKTSPNNCFIVFGSAGCVACVRIAMQSLTLSLSNTSCRCCSIQSIPLLCWAKAKASHAMALVKFRKQLWIKLPADHPAETRTFLLVCLALESTLDLLSGPHTELAIATWHVEATLPCTSCLVSRWGTHLPSFINSPICSRYQILLNSVEFLATSCVVIIVSASTMVLR